MKTFKSALAPALLAVALAAVCGGAAAQATVMVRGGHGGHGWHGGGGWHGGWHGRSSFGVTIGGPLYWPSYPSYPSYSYYPPAYYYNPPPVVVVPPATPPTYIEQGNPDQYWYFCADPQGYYPYVKECPRGWQQVAPQPADAQ